MRLKYSCEYCSFSEIQHFRNQVIGQPYHAGSGQLCTVNFGCPRCGVTQWNISRDFRISERLFFGFYQQVADTLGKLGLKQHVFQKDLSVEDWMNTVDENRIAYNR